MKIPITIAAIIKIVTRILVIAKKIRTINDIARTIPKIINPVVKSILSYLIFFTFEESLYV